MGWRLEASPLTTTWCAASIGAICLYCQTGRSVAILTAWRVLVEVQASDKRVVTSASEGIAETTEVRTTGRLADF
jgi:hypothetical protein